MTPRMIDAEEYARLMKGVALEKVHRFVPCAVRLPDGRVAKVFRPPPFWSSRMFRPQVRSFVHAARQLAELGICAPQVTEVLRLKRPCRDIVCYIPIPGQSLRPVVRASENPAALLQTFAVFVGNLHRKGVFFRGLHLGNVILSPEGDFGLIDFADVSFLKQPLSIRQRVRNFRHFYKHRKDAVLMRRVGLPLLVEAYLSSAGMTESEWRAFRRGVAALER